jgi:steroid delta-isomerase-like uncharacterized protein
MSENVEAPSERLDHEGAREFYDRYLELLNERDVRHIPALYTEDVEFEDDAWPEIVRGHAEMERFLGTLWRAFPDCRFEVVNGPYLSADGRHIAAWLRVSGTARGSFGPPGFAPTDTLITTELGVFYELEGERVKRARIIANMNDFGIQIGAAPAPGSRGERLAVAMQRLTARRMRRRAKGVDLATRTSGSE